MTRWPPLAATAGLLLGGAYAYAEQQDVTGVALLAAGLISLGCWLAVEVRRDRHDHKEGPDHE